MERDFTQVDVFARVPLRGNPVAVVHDAEGLDEGLMQAFARWTNLSETTFLLAPTEPEADYRLRIFTPGGELPFAGHPTLGSAHAWAQRGGAPRGGVELVQQCGVGLVRIRRDGGRLAFAAPPVRMSEADDALLNRVLAALGVPAARLVRARWLDNGPRWLALLLDDADMVSAIEPDHSALKSLAKVGVVAPYPAGSPCAFEVRAFAAMIGVPEDPVTGSLNASLGQWLIGDGIAPARYVASQGGRLGRSGRVHVERDDDQVWVGGECVTCVRGKVTL